MKTYKILLTMGEEKNLADLLSMDNSAATMIVLRTALTPEIMKEMILENYPCAKNISITEV